MRCWPGGLCLSRSIGDMDVGEFVVPVPYVKQVKVGYCSPLHMLHYVLQFSSTLFSISISLRHRILYSMIFYALGKCG